MCVTYTVQISTTEEKEGALFWTLCPLISICGKVESLLPTGIRMLICLCCVFQNFLKYENHLGSNDNIWVYSYPLCALILIMTVENPASLRPGVAC